MYVRWPALLILLLKKTASSRYVHTRRRNSFWQIPRRVSFRINQSKVVRALTGTGVCYDKLVVLCNCYYQVILKITCSVKGLALNCADVYFLTFNRVTPARRNEDTSFCSVISEAKISFRRWDFGNNCYLFPGRFLIFYVLVTQDLYQGSFLWNSET